jgi:hypothetical protein
MTKQTQRGNNLRLIAAPMMSMVMILLLGACGITAPSRSEGFAELESLGFLDVDRTMSLSIGPTLLKFAARHIDDDPETAALLRDLDGVRIRIYEIDGDAQRVSGRIQRMGEHLQEDGWEPVMLVREDTQTTQMLAKTNAGTIRGLTLLSTDGESEAIVINLMGDIQPERFNDVILALDIDTPKVPDIETGVAAN